MNFLRFAATIPDKEKVIKFLQKHELLPISKVCSNRHEMKLQVRKQSRRRCYVKECRKEISIRIKTWFEGIKISSKREFYFYIISPLKRLQWNIVRRSWR
uniref:LAGLIDADG_2 domain-containing protein n=1 Tax=Strongyloides stercoralis TaxID=6248 RepID=A0A0K0DRY7_STRER